MRECISSFGGSRVHSKENVNERKLKDFMLKRFERHFQLPVGNSDYPKGPTWQC